MSVTVLCLSFMEMSCILSFTSPSHPLETVLWFFPCHKQGREAWIRRWSESPKIKQLHRDGSWIQTSLPHYNSPNLSTNCNSQRTTINILKKDSLGRSINWNLSFTDQRTIISLTLWLHRKLCHRAPWSLTKYLHKSHSVLTTWWHRQTRYYP